MNKTFFVAALTATTMLGATVALSQPPGRGNPEKMIERRDTNGDGMVSFEEFQMPPRAEERFTRADADGDGEVTRAELEATLSERSGGALERFEQVDANDDDVVTEAERKQAMFENIDTNGDGQLDAEELLQAQTTIREQVKERRGTSKDGEGS